MNYQGRNYRTVWFENGSVQLINQPTLPFAFEIVSSPDYQATAVHIRDMTVRGAPAIGAAGAFGMAQAVIAGGTAGIEQAEAVLKGTRPTAHDLFAGVDHVLGALQGVNAPEAPEAAVRAAQAFADASADECRLIGEHGARLLGSMTNILTHCNAGWLACVDWGTALAPIYTAFRNGKKLFVYADETAPRGQGARLTAWELQNEGVPHAVIADNAAAHYMSKGKVHVVITGADRVAMNGDAANKIGTLEKAICARRFGIPFYIAVPMATIDPDCPAGRDIIIEERGSDEVRFRTGLDASGGTHTIQVVNPGSVCLNPAFDVTPAELITGFITPRGIVKPADITTVLPNT